MQKQLGNRCSCLPKETSGLCRGLTAGSYGLGWVGGELQKPLFEKK